MRTGTSHPWDLPLETLSKQLSLEAERRDFYNCLSANRSHWDPGINAFEQRQENCPVTVHGPLNGLPITVKDQIAVAGWQRTFGTDRPAKKPDRKSAPVVARLEDLGAIVTGKTALPPHAMDFQTYSKRRGPTCNPFDQDYTCGGSSGGGAAAVATGMSCLDVGADLSGSLRIPAAWCGVSSLVPTEGALSNKGMLPKEQTLDHFARIGFLARSPEDLEFLWRTAFQPEAPPELDRTPDRIAIWAPGAASVCDRATLHTWETFRKTVIGSSRDLVDEHGMTDLLESRVRCAAGEILGYETGALMPGIIRWLLRRDRRAAAGSPGFLAPIHEGYRRNSKRYMNNLKTLDDFRTSMGRTYADHRALVLPVTGVCAFPHRVADSDQNGVRRYDEGFATQAGKIGYFDALTHFTVPVTVLGWPVVTIPIGKDPNGIPVGAQITGRPGTEIRLLETAAKLMEITGGQIMPGENSR
ncbi:amidase [Labrenzia sp. R4_1]|uniref:amidase family protein n=1 Tax=Labrenzia sp. R4_1 TaxID=2821106 RepID=UPI001ADC0965|nr:amidase [Labrenzia sp. R4_1]MBO9427046.1 amidase [Labrenzia sp. R4_1]